MHLYIYTAFNFIYLHLLIYVLSCSKHFISSTSSLTNTLHFNSQLSDHHHFFVPGPSSSKLLLTNFIHKPILLQTFVRQSNSMCSSIHHNSKLLLPFLHLHAPRQSGEPEPVRYSSSIFFLFFWNFAVPLCCFIGLSSR